MFTPAFFMGGFRVGAADFDGTNDNLRLNAGLTGAVDGKSGTLSVWVRLDGGNGSVLTVLQGLGGLSAFNVLRSNLNVFSIRLDKSADGAIGLQLDTVNTYLAGVTWLHLLASWDVNAGVAHLYINDVSDENEVTLLNATLDYTVTEWDVGSTTSDTSRFNGAMAEFYLKLNAYIDLSVEANRRKFISPTGKPVNLGANGSAPGLGVPEIYLHLASGESASNFAINRGGGGNFTVVGALDSADGP